MTEVSRRCRYLKGFVLVQIVIGGILTNQQQQDEIVQFLLTELLWKPFSGDSEEIKTF